MAPRYTQDPLTIENIARGGSLLDEEEEEEGINTYRWRRRAVCMILTRTRNDSDVNSKECCGNLKQARESMEAEHEEEAIRKQTLAALPLL
jgi:hypothetical protein